MVYFELRPTVCPWEGYKVTTVEGARAHAATPPPQNALDERRERHAASGRRRAAARRALVLILGLVLSERLVAL